MQSESERPALTAALRALGVAVYGPDGAVVPLLTLLEDAAALIARLTAERSDALVRADQAEAALAHHRDGQWRGGAELQQALMDYAREVARFRRTQNADKRATSRARAIALYEEIAPRLDADDPRRRTVEQLRALLTGDGA